MKCKICGKRANSLKAMGAHYRKKHPSSMKRKRQKHTLLSSPGGGMLTPKGRATEAVLLKRLTDSQKIDLIVQYVPLGAIIKKLQGY